MRKFTIAAIAVLSIAGSGAVYAQFHRPWMSEHMRHMRMNPEDRAAFVDARIAAVHAGLKLNADQEKLWPPVEAAVRELAKLRIDRANARMNAGPGDAAKETATPEDPVARLRQRAEDMGATSAALKKIADAADPLYKTLDEGQKRRLAVLTRHRGPFGGGEGGWHHRFMERGMDRMMEHGMDRFHGGDRFDRDGGPDSDREGRL
ncbi:MULTISPECIES: Spy/CpxP family protein refolding chaperone [unclassified Bradyrhizobium]|uniref:Spy/CpxP family protein refolding chaperone n=1 Tax=unclassified Bradyrhizobium TaxID=2631580 RepID=UPI002478B8E0|nr:MULTISPECIES: Spy/CpxP family protein refolding chaperone [unclassified Bradyrhizobium]WGR69698.1 Spy/CpxP family protein refolding chaperone [Bradyrhizobium sp. ISRA426]WGR81754.1 Spy/CpxP family protein refolding chaperone [Bradyrhizobium sp. ISRA430]WGR84940.1 Spy/CpxP family protein refolding chaperone [Bradyrhizobium sp. ISRA432]